MQGVQELVDELKSDRRLRAECPRCRRNFPFREATVSRSRSRCPRRRGDGTRHPGRAEEAAGGAEGAEAAGEGEA